MAEDPQLAAAVEAAENTAEADNIVGGQGRVTSLYTKRHRGRSLQITNGRAKATPTGYKKLDSIRLITHYSCDFFHVGIVRAAASARDF